MLQANVLYKLQGPIVFAGRVINEITFTYNYNTYISRGVVYDSKVVRYQD